MQIVYLLNVWHLDGGYAMHVHIIHTSVTPQLTS